MSTDKTILLFASHLCPSVFICGNIFWLRPSTAKLHCALCLFRSLCAKVVAVSRRERRETECTEADTDNSARSRRKVDEHTRTPNFGRRNTNLHESARICTNPETIRVDSRNSCRFVFPLSIGVRFPRLWREKSLLNTSGNWYFSRRGRSRKALASASPGNSQVCGSHVSFLPCQ